MSTTWQVPQLTSDRVLQQLLTSMPVMPGGTGRRNRGQTFFRFTYFHGPSAARPLGWPLRMTNGKVRALRTDKALRLARMDTNISLAGLAAGWAGQIGAAYSGRVHARPPPRDVGEHAKRSMAGPPFSLQADLTTV
jgi:hypothetical protein